MKVTSLTCLRLRQKGLNICKKYLVIIIFFFGFFWTDSPKLVLAEVPKCSMRTGSILGSRPIPSRLRRSLSVAAPRMKEQPGRSVSKGTRSSSLTNEREVKQLPYEVPATLFKHCILTSPPPPPPPSMSGHLS